MIAAAPDVPALQALVAAEQAAVFGLSAAGGRLANLAPGSPAASTVRDAYDVHRLRRDAWATALRSHRAAVPAAAAAYALPPLGDAGAAGTAAAGIEQRCTDAYVAALTGLTDRRLRVQVVAALTDAARRRYALLLAAGTPPQTASTAFPGQVG